MDYGSMGQNTVSTKSLKGVTQYRMEVTWKLYRHI